MFAVIVISPVEDKEPTKVFLTINEVSEIPEFASVFNVLTVSYGKLNNEIFLLASCNFALLLTINEFDTAVVEIALSSLIEDEVKMLITVLVKIVPAVVAN